MAYSERIKENVSINDGQHVNVGAIELWKRDKLEVLLQMAICEIEWSSS
jgi:hypothetical protein